MPPSRAPLRRAGPPIPRHWLRILAAALLLIFPLVARADLPPRPPARRELAPEVRQRFAAALRDAQEKHAVFAQAQRELESLIGQLQREQEEEQRTCSQVKPLMARLQLEGDKPQRLQAQVQRLIEHVEQLRASTSDIRLQGQAEEQLARAMEELAAQQAASDSIAARLEELAHGCVAHTRRVVELKQQQKQSALRGVRAMLDLTGQLDPEAPREVLRPGDER
ncbi:MAG: hypothetical protein JXB05_07205 [Myxococcaceae bacterium]|nr:hypothetical protein [Myxococcaceae bacterium]